MYREFYRLSDEPFRVTPDPDFLFLADQYKEALAAIVYGIAKRKGFVCITGEVGVGKTTILRSYLNSVEDQGLTFVYIFNPKISFAVLMRTILRDLGRPNEGDVPELVERLHEHLIGCYRQNKTVVLFVDEAQNMPVETLENLRMLSNLETTTDKLIQIVLVGQPELDELLSRPQLRQLKSRIVVRAKLGPLSKADSLDYIRHRLSRVALDDRAVFSDAAMRLVVKQAQGVPRIINILCDAALITGFGYRVRPVPPKVIREVIRDTFGGDQSNRRRWVMAAGAAAVAGSVAGFWMVQAGSHHRSNDPIADLIRSTQQLASAPEQPNAPPAPPGKPEVGSKPPAHQPPTTDSTNYGPAGEGPDPGSDLVRVISPLPKASTPPPQQQAAASPPPAEAKVEAKPETKPKTEAKAEVKTEPKPEAKSDVKPEAKATPADPEASSPAAPMSLQPTRSGATAAAPPQRAAHSDRPRNEARVAVNTALGETGDPPDTAPQRLVVKPGDTLSKLSISVYGTSDTEILGQLQHANPSITDVDRLYVGQVIAFPSLPGPKPGDQEAALRKER